MKIAAVAPWFGSNRMLAEQVGKLLEGCSWVGIPFAGSMAEVPHIRASTIVVSDIHWRIINLARVMADTKSGPRLIRRLRRVIFHDQIFRESQEWLKNKQLPTIIDEDAAYHYFIAAWMGRSGKAGTKHELGGSISTRWDAGGGDSAIRFFNAVESIKSWRHTLKRCTFLSVDAFNFISKVKDSAKNGIYCDPPFPGPGDSYEHSFTLEQQRLLAKDLLRFNNTRIVCRFYDVPLIRELYQESDWIRRCLEGRKQTNDVAPEVLLVRNAI